MKNGRPCILVLTAPRSNRHAMSRHSSMASALRKARDFSLPYKLYTPEGELLRKGWLLEA